MEETITKSLNNGDPNNEDSMMFTHTTILHEVSSIYVDSKILFCAVFGLFIPTIILSVSYAHIG